MYTSDNKIITLGTELGRGGEGCVFEVPNYPEIVAKIYHHPIEDQKALKIKSMVEMKNERLLKITAWPIDVLYKDKSGIISGILMPKISGFKEIHKLYGLKTRLNEFPDVTWSFLIQASANLARVFGEIHNHGHVIGDVNHGNFLVSDKAIVKLIDCDSLQIKYKDKIFYCDVGVPTHQPPEFQELNSFRGITRTFNHDNFGLAILIFQLLFLGRHPFSGVFLGIDEMPLEKAIKEFRFAYGANAIFKQMKQPPNSLKLEVISPQISNLFERAFAPEGIKENIRPAPNEWIDALLRFGNELGTCNKNNGHIFRKSMGTCPWCEFESKIQIIIFLPHGDIVPSTFDLLSTWTRIKQITPPGPPPKLPLKSNNLIKADEKFQSLSKYKKFRNAITLLSGLCTIGISIYIFYLFGFGIGVFTFIITSFIVYITSISHKIGNAKAEIERELLSTRHKVQQLEKQWLSDSGDLEFNKKTNELEKVKNAYQDLNAERERRFKALEQERYKYQLEKFLDKFYIFSSQIDGIGPSRKVTLQSHGIETAADIEKNAIIKIQGFGPVYTNKLIAWRTSKEYNFVFNPNQPMDSSKIDALDNDIKALKNKYENILINGINELNSIKIKVENTRHAFYDQYEQCLKELCKAEANISLFVK